jgi:hypothetical protein
VSALTRLRTSTFATLDLFLTLGLLGIYLKGALLGQQWDAVARFVGKVDPRDLRLLERLGFFHRDITLNVLVVPVVATALFCVLFGRFRVVAAMLTTVILSLLYYVELQAHKEVGQYLSSDLLGDLVRFGIGNPGMNGDYWSLASIFKLAALIAIILAIARVARVARVAEQQLRIAAAQRYRLILQIPAVMLLAGGLVLSMVGFAVRFPDSLLNESSVGRAFVALMAPNHEQDLSRFGTMPQVLDAMRAQTRSAPFDPHHPLVGRERDSDLLIFMMETGPTQALDLAESGRTLPGAGPLYDRSLVTLRHYTTHPYSSDAMYSILSGLYPQGRRRLLQNARSDRVNGLMTALEADTPIRRVYVPSLYNIDLDARMYAVLGADTLYAVDKEPLDPLRTVAGRRADELLEFEVAGSRSGHQPAELLRRRLRADFQALERVKADITAAVRAGQRYAVLFFPEVGHAPWQSLNGQQTVLARGRALMLLQDAWLKELVDTIRSLGRLERTVIAVTADHGIRTRAEDPALPIGRISDYMFQVPLLVYAPQTLKQTLTISTPTSHIDFAPTVAALFGKSESVSRMVGVPIWQRRRGDRLYFLGSTYGGADGFVEDGTYYMRQALSGAVYSNTSFSFTEENQATPSSPVIKWTTDALADAAHLQQALVTHMLREPPH